MFLSVIDGTLYIWGIAFMDFIFGAFSFSFLLWGSIMFVMFAISLWKSVKKGEF